MIEPGALIQAWTPDRIAAEISTANDGIKTALRRGDMEAALVQISRKTGLRICAGDIVVKLKNKRMA